MAEQMGFDLAQRYTAQSDALRSALQIPSAAPIDVHPLAQGEHNSNFWFRNPADNRKYVLRINYVSQMGVEHQVAYEHNALASLAPSGHTPQPILCDESRSIIDHGVLVESFVEGRIMDYGRADDMARAAAILADIHSVSTDAADGILEPSDPLSEQLGECEGYLDVYRTSSMADPFVVDALEKMLQKARETMAQLPPASGRAHILNTEAVRMHFLLSDDGAGHMVDWEKPIIGEAAQDVSYFLSPTTTIWDTEVVFDQKVRQAFVGEYWRCVDGRFPRESFDERFSAYTMSNCLRGITWSANAYVEYHGSTRPLQNDRTRKKLDDYLNHRFIRYVDRTFFDG